MNRFATYRARWIVPMAGLPISGGYVSVGDGTIVELGARSAGPAVDLGDVCVLPGFVNAHLHLDLPRLPDGFRTATSFPGWLRRVVQCRRAATESDVQAWVQSGIRELVHSGTTLVGDIAATPHSAAALRASGISAVVFREVLGLRPERYEPLWQVAAEWIESPDQLGLERGISPHAPYSTAREVYRRVASLPPSIPRATHWFESLEEREFLQTGQGPLRPFLEELGALDPSLRWPIDPWSFLDPRAEAGRFTLVHANYLGRHEVAALRSAGAAGVVFCPRTHAFFQHAPHPWHRLRALGIPVALGTDSRASSPDLQVFDEARFLFAHDPNADPQTLCSLLTQEGATVLGWGERAGVLAPGKQADLVVLKGDFGAADDPFEHLFSLQTEIVGVMGRGVWLRCPPIDLAQLQ